MAVVTTVRCDMSVSLDGFICGPKAKDPPYFDDGFFRVTAWLTELATWRERHAGWEGGARDADDDVLADTLAQAAAYVMGRRMFDSGEEPWGPEPPFRAPVFVVTHRQREPLERAGGTTFHFVTGGLGAAVDQAKAAADDGHVAISGGASTVQQAITAGLLDELHLHITPVLLGAGTRLLDNLPAQILELDRTRLATSPSSQGVSHLSFAFPTNTNGHR
jgi:dihydrofolate reductase